MNILHDIPTLNMITYRSGCPAAGGAAMRWRKLVNFNNI